MNAKHMAEKIFHLTKKKLAELKKEHAELLKIEREQALSHEAPKLLESDDLSSEFVSYQENVEKLKGRINELRDILENHQIIKKPPKEKAIFVDVGATVHLESDGRKHTFIITGTLEADPDEGKISNQSPLGMALVGRKVGDVVKLDSPEEATYKIKNINYEIG